MMSMHRTDHQNDYHLPGLDRLHSRHVRNRGDVQMSIPLALSSFVWAQIALGAVLLRIAGVL